MDIILVIILVVLILFQFRGVLTHDYQSLWSPMTVISLVYVYYVVFTFYKGGNRLYSIVGMDNTLVLIGAVVSFIFVMIGYSMPIQKDLKKWNNTFSKKNIFPSAILLFAVGFIGYSIFRGFHFTAVADEDNPVQSIAHSGLDSYFVELALLLPASLGLIVYSFKEKVSKKWVWIIIYLIVVVFLVKGTRSRIVYASIVSCAAFYLYPKPRKPNYAILLGLIVGLYMLFSFMEYTRSYSNGLRMELAQDYTINELTAGASENSSVFWFSSIVMNKYTNENTYVYFEPLLTAALMPVPRAIAPWKPNGQYIIDAQVRTIGHAEGGAAFLYFTEGYISFSWFGLIIYGFMLGWLSKLYWSNYKRNPQSIGAIMAMSLFGAACYAFVSRGILASSFELFIYIVCLPFWIVRLAAKIFPIFRP